MEFKNGVKSRVSVKSIQTGYIGARMVFVENTRLIRVSRKRINRKMASQYSDILNSQESEGMALNKIGLPIEMWSKMFGYLDFATQNCATLVCKLWLEMIRNEFKLSGELTMNSMDKMEATEINSIISKWKKLKILRALSHWHPQVHSWGERSFVFPTVDLKILEIEFHLCPTLERVVVPVVANTTNNGPGVTFYFDKNAVDDLNRMLPTWAKVSKIWFDPQIKEIQKLELENVSELCLTLDEKGESVESLETIGASMVNLDSLCIWIKEVERDEYPEHNIDYCLPLLKNLPSNLHLELTILDPMTNRPSDLPIDNEYFYPFIKHFALKVSSLKVYISVTDWLLNLDSCWIRYFENLEKLEMKFLNYEIMNEDDVIEELCQNPLFKLKHFRNPRFFYKRDTFLMRIFEAFPMIETLVIDQHCYCSWLLENLLSVLQSLLSIKNLSFSDTVNLVGSDFSLAETKFIFEAAFDLIKQFPDDSIIKIEERVYGYKIIKEKGMLPRIYHRNCIYGCTSKWSYHTVCKFPPSRIKKSVNTIIDFFLSYESQLYGSIVNTEITLIEHKDISVEVTENIFAVLLDIINKFPIEICLKVIDDVHGYRIIKEEMKEPRIYHRICEKDCTVKFSFHSICIVLEKLPQKSKNSAL